MTVARVVVHPGRQALADGVAARLAVTVLDAQSAGRPVHLALTGGSMGSAIWSSMRRLPARDAVDWASVHIWWGDERYLPTGDPDRNDTQNDEAGLAAIGLDPGNVHRVRGPDASESAEASATAYAQELRDRGSGAFEVVVLGVGPDGHMASLFPGHPAAATTGAIAIAVHESPKPPPDRVSLTLECLSRAREVWYVVSGADKADAVARALAGDDFSTTPAGHAQGSERTLWLIDDAATRTLR